MRGQVYELEEKKIFTFGGASSHDIDGGILELDDPDYKKRKKELDKGWKPYRINHLSWWKEGKIERNMERDKENDQQLLFQGWTVIHFWGNDIKKHLDDCIKVIEELIFEQIVETDPNVLEDNE